jgi:hypothetical protein
VGFPLSFKDRHFIWEFVFESFFVAENLEWRGATVLISVLGLLVVFSAGSHETEAGSDHVGG